MDKIYLEISSLSELLQIDEKSSLVGLEKSAIDNLPTKKRQHATDEVNISGIVITPWKGTKSILCKGNATNAGRTYNPMIMFNNVQFEDANTEDNITFKGTDNQEYHVRQIDAQQNMVQVRCSCLDFYYRFATWNRADGSLYGRKAKPYVRKTDNYPPVNPAKAQGLCKHLMKLAEMLHDTKLIIN